MKRENVMERVPVRSRDIAIVGYDRRNAILEVAFRSGGVYHYAGVPQDICENLMTASSQSSYFNDVIRDQYPYVRIH